jgi:hypothetical protein
LCSNSGRKRSELEKSVDPLAQLTDRDHGQRSELTGLGAKLESGRLGCRGVAPNSLVLNIGQSDRPRLDRLLSDLDLMLNESFRRGRLGMRATSPHFSPASPKPRGASVSLAMGVTAEQAETRNRDGCATML